MNSSLVHRILHSILHGILHHTPCGSARWRRAAPAVRRIRAVLACAVLGACSGHVAPGAATAPVGATSLSDADITLYAELLSAADARRVDTVLVHRGLSSRARAVRVEAVRSAGQGHAAVLAPTLRAVVSDPDTAVAATAAFALGLLHDTGGVSALGAALHRAPTVAVEAAWSLGEIGEPARSVLETAIGGDSLARAPEAAAQELVAAGKLRPVPVERIASVLASGSGDRDLRVTRAAAYALSRPPAPGGVRALLGVAQSRDVDTRLAVARGIGRRAAGDSLADLARQALVALAADSNAHVRAIAVQSLASYGEAERVPVVTALRDSDANVRIAASQVLDRVLGVGGGRSRGSWLAAFKADTTLAYRRGVVASAVRGGVILEVIDHDNWDRWQRQGDWRYRAAAAEAAAGTPMDRTVDLALPLTRDPDGRVRAAAYGVFEPWLDSADAVGHPWRRTYVRGALHDADCVVRAGALSALAGAASGDDAAAAVDGYLRARDDTQSNARVAALQLLAAAWKHDSMHVPDSTRAAVRRLPIPTSLLELDQAGPGSLWSEWRAARAEATPRNDLAWYERIVRTIVVPSLAGRGPVARIQTVRGTLTVALLGGDAPLTVANFAALARAGYYRGTAFHRVVPAFVAQDGDPRGDGSGGPAYSIRDELNRDRYQRGAVGMALSGPDTGGSQYFLTLTPQPHLDGHYTVFGTLVDGFAALDQLVQGDAIDAVDVP